MKEILTEKELKVISKYLPAQKKRGRPNKDRIQMLRGIVYVLKTSTQWSYLPSEFGKKSTVHGTFMRWIKEGVFSINTLLLFLIAGSLSVLSLGFLIIAL